MAKLILKITEKLGVINRKKSGRIGSRKQLGCYKNLYWGCP